MDGGPPEDAQAEISNRCNIYGRASRETKRDVI
jgi:hypothetical protein